MKVNVRFDERLMRRRLGEYVRRSGSSGIDALNKAGKNASFRAIRYTPKTTLAQITADVGTQAHPKPGPRGAYALYQFKHPGSGSLAPSELRRRVVRMIAAKRSSIAYIAAGFLKALRVFANSTRDVTPNCLAARGYGLKARPGRKYSEIMNTAPGADTVAAGPLARGAEDGIKDMMSYLSHQQAMSARRFNS